MENKLILDKPQENLIDLHNELNVYFALCISGITVAFFAGLLCAIFINWLVVLPFAGFIAIVATVYIFKILKTKSKIKTLKAQEELQIQQ